jgi:hypothetical protein
MRNLSGIFAVLTVVGTAGCAREKDSGTALAVESDSGTGGSGAGGAGGGTGGTKQDGAADSGGDRGDEPAPAREPVCDGSDGVRLILTRGGGGAGSGGTDFEYPYGRAFAFVDGHCRFVTGTEQQAGYRSGELSPEQAAELSAESAWNALPILDGFEGPNCIEGGFQVVADGTHQMLWHCPGTDHAKEQAIFDWFERFHTLGQLLNGPVRVLTRRQDAPDGSVVHDWPLSVDPALALGPENVAPTASSGMRFEDPADTAALRGLRAMSDFGGAYSPMMVRVRSGSDTYIAYIRDELPAEMQSAVETAWATIEK